MKMAFVLAGLSLYSISSGFMPISAEAQGYRNDNPNMRNFYMARQQIQIMDDAPQVNDMRTNPTAPVPQINAPRALPRAGFGSYVNPSLVGGSMSSGLPQVVNGVPKAPPPAAAPPKRGGPTGQRATANKIKQTAAGPTTVKAYKPYQTYQSAAPASSGTGGGMINSQSNVSGSVLHWNRKKSLQY